MAPWERDSALRWVVCWRRGGIIATASACWRGCAAKEPPRHHGDAGHWGEISFRMERLLATREAATRQEQLRLQSFLSAIDASPNGVLLLDSEGQITWCNATAAQHFGLDPVRDLRQRVTNLVRAPDFVSYLQAGQFERPVMLEGAVDRRRSRCWCVPMGRACSWFFRRTSPSASAPMGCGVTSWPTCRTKSARRSRCWPASWRPGHPAPVGRRTGAGAEPDAAADRPHAESGGRPADLGAAGRQPASRDRPLAASGAADSARGGRCPGAVSRSARDRGRGFRGCRSGRQRSRVAQRRGQPAAQRRALHARWWAHPRCAGIHEPTTAPT
jgi:PAS domain-containing protein